MSETGRIGERWLKSGKIALQFGEIRSSKEKVKQKQDSKNGLLGI